MEQRLSDNWITTNHIDFEYKKYILLAYLQHVNDCFEETKLYPALSELVKHYRNLVALRDQKNSLYNKLSRKIKFRRLTKF